MPTPSAHRAGSSSSSTSSSSSPSPNTPGAKASPSLPAISRQDSRDSSSPSRPIPTAAAARTDSSGSASSATSSGSSTPTLVVSSPLNPNAPPRVTSSPRTTPTRAPIPLPATTGSSQPTVRARPPSFDAARRPSPLTASSAAQHDEIPVARVRSNPLPIFASSTSQAQMLTPDAPRGFMASIRARTRSLSPDARTVIPDRDDKDDKGEGDDGEDRPSLLSPVLSFWQIHRDGGSKREPRPWTDPSAVVVPAKKRTVPVEQTESYVTTKQHVASAAAAVLDVAKLTAHEALFIGVDLVKLAPIPLLEVAGMALLNIWDALEAVEMNRLACLRLTERCAQILLSVREEIVDAPHHVADELQAPVRKLEAAFGHVHALLLKQAHRPFLKRYLKRDEIQRSIDFCNAELGDALNMFGVSIQIRTLKLVQENELRRQREADALLDGLGLSSFPGSPPPLYEDGPPTPKSKLPTSPTAAKDLVTAKDAADRDVARALARLRREQNARDRAHDMADLRALMRAALQTNNDAAMIEVLQVGRDEMPEAIKTLQRALEREMEIERGSSASGSSLSGMDEDDGASVVGIEFKARGRPRAATVSVAALAMGMPVVGTPSEEGGDSRRLGTSGTGSPGGDTLDREFLEGGIEALRRLSQGTDLAVPSWTITKYEVDLEQKVGIGFFSDVYRARWRDAVVAVKVLAETTPKAMFVREMGIWKSLEHPNVLELYGASSATGEPPWFFVSPYYKNGSLVRYLKSLDPSSSQQVDALKMMNQVARGMAYLHARGVLHGDLKGANVLVDDGLHCVIADFGQSEMKSEVVRLSGAVAPRGTLRWQAPEIMRGDGELTPEVDVYAFGILCVEILGRGNLPWPMVDDDAVRRFVLDEDKRPNLPNGTPLTHSSGFLAILHSAWARDPTARPTFTRLSRELKALREKAGIMTAESPRAKPMSLVWEEEAAHKHVSPDMRPVKLPETQDDLQVHASSDDTSYLTAQSNFPDYSAPTTPSASRRSTVIVDDHESVITLQSSRSANSSILDRSLVLEGSVLGESGTLSPTDMASNVLAIMTERRYRLLLQHEYHTTLTLPLWTPTPVRLGAVGYLSKPEGRFVTLLNCFDDTPGFPRLSRSGSGPGPGINGKSKVDVFSARNEKRSAAQRGIDMIRNFVWGAGDRGSRSTVTRTQAFQLRAGHRVAYLYAESTVYRYMEDLSLPKAWFEANIDQVLAVHGADHKLTREDVFLIIGTLEAQDHAMFVSHQHPDGQMNFNIFAGARPGEPWGAFVPTTSTVPAPSISGPRYDDETLSQGTLVWDRKVSTVHDGPWDAVLLARLRFKTDATEPTRL